MGLDVSHDAYSGGYISFMSFRVAVIVAMGGTYKDGSFVLAEGDDFDKYPGMFEFFSHSDCDGDIAPKVAAEIAGSMEGLLPTLDACGAGGGHIARNGGFGMVARQWITGCRVAAANGQPLTFS